MNNSIKYFCFLLTVLVVITFNNDCNAQELSDKSFGRILPDSIHWTAFPAFPPTVRIAVLVGNPSNAAPFIVRVKVPDGVKLMPG